MTNSPQRRALSLTTSAPSEKTEFVNNFWRALAHDPGTLKRTWESIKQVMGPGALDAKRKKCST